MRIDKLLANLKYGSRKKIKKLLKRKLITVNGKIITDGAFHVDEKKDHVTIYGEKVYYRKYVYLMLNKPKGYISATNDNYHKTVIDLLNSNYRNFGLFPCGRLDIDTEGLLILTNNGNFSHKLTHPNKEIYKKYYVEVDKEINRNDKIAFNKGIDILDGNNKVYHTKKAYLDIIDKYKANVSISEGKYH